MHHSHAQETLVAVTRSQVDKLGEKLRRGAGSDDSLLEQLQAFRAEFDPPLARALEVVGDAIDAEPAGRIKTVNTIVEKLIRSKTRLSTMQDIAGVRVVLDCDLEAQNDAVDRLLAAFPGAKVDDLRDAPHYGYRAVHVIALVGGFPVEIQVRTRLQDLCAQALEKLADKVGRGIRYGEPPLVKTIDGTDVAAMVETTRSISDIVRDIEAMLVAARKIEDRRGRDPQIEDAALRQALEPSAAQLAEFRARLSAHENEVRAWLLDFVQILDN